MDRKTQYSCDPNGFGAGKRGLHGGRLRAPTAQDGAAQGESGVGDSDRHRPRRAPVRAPVDAAGRIDAAYLAATPAQHRKAFAQVLTPPDLADLMADWVAQVRPGRVLDPAFGTGVLARAMVRACPGIAVTGHEADPQIAEAGRAACAAAGFAPDLRIGDFLSTPPEPVEAVIANPPWLRPRHGFSAAIDGVARRSGLVLSGLTNAYVLFVLDCCLRLRPGGRGAFLLPAEWANANSCAPLKAFLLDRGYLRRLVHVCNLRPVFSDALTTASLVLVEAPPAAAPVDRVEVLFVGPDADLPRPGAPGRTIPAAALRGARNWDALLRGEAGALPPGHVRLGALASTRRGLATGANGFFHLTRAQALLRGIAPARLRPCVAKAADAPGRVFDVSHLARLEARGRPGLFLDLTPPLAPAEAAYVAEGAAQGVDQRFLTRNRTPWHAPERLHVAPIWASTFARGDLRFVWNAAGALQMTAFHGIFPERTDPVFLRALTACLNAPVTRRRAEGQLRHYGGGLRKIEPRDLAEIIVPDLRRISEPTLAALAAALTGPEARLDALAARAGEEAT